MDEGVAIPITARPGSAREAIAWDPWRRSWVVRVRARPVQGEANDAILRALAVWLGVRPSDVSWLRAGKGSSKLARARGVGPEEVERRLREACARTDGTTR